MKKEEFDENVPVNVPRLHWLNMEKKRYSDPKIHIPKRNGRATIQPNRRWYVYFYWRSDPSGPLDKKFSFTKSINRIKEVKERRAAAKILQQAISSALERGWNPITKETSKVKPAKARMTVEKAFEFAYTIKASTKKEPTLKGYKFHTDRFLDWSKRNGFLGASISKFTLDHFYEFYDYLRFEYRKENGQHLSATSINNHKRTMSAFFTTLKNERIIATNFIKDIPKLEEEPENNKAFSFTEIQEIKKVLLKKDPYLIHFISFMLYPLLRPREICRLKVKDLNLEQGILSVQTKTEALSQRRIIVKIKPTIEALAIGNSPGNYHLFSNENKPKDWSTAKLQSRVDHFSARFKKIKTEMGYGRDYGLYSFRHSAIVDLYYSLQKTGLGEQEILLKLMPYTLHKSIAGIKNYLRNLVKTIPPDHSDIYTIDF